MKLNELLQSIATVTGQSDDEQIKTLLANEALEVEIDNSIKDKFLSNIYSKEAAKNDREIQDFYYDKIQKGIYSKVDEVVFEQLDTLGVSEDTRKEIESYDSSMKKLKGLLAAAKDKKGAKTDNSQEIEALHAKLKNLQQEKDNEVNKLILQQKADKVNFLGKNRIYNYKLVDNIPGGKDYLAEATINKLSNDYHLELDGNTINVKQKDDTSSDVYINNEKVTFEGLLDKELDQFIKRNEDPKPNPEQKRFEAREKKLSEMTLHEQIRANKKPSSLSYR